MSAPVTLSRGTLDLLADFEFWRRMRLYAERTADPVAASCLNSEARARAEAANAVACELAQQIDEVLEARFRASPDVYCQDSWKAVLPGRSQEGN